MTGRRMLVDGKVFLVGTGVDITARKKAEEVLKEAKESAEAANRAKSEFLNNIAHDFRTPVHAIMGFSSLLHSEHMTEKQKKFAGVINESSHDLLRLVEELLDVSRLESGRLELKVSEFDVRKCLDHAVKVAQIELIDKEVKLRHWMEGSILPVKGDETRFNQILANLIGNAVKYTDKGEIIVKIDGDQQGCSPGKCRIRLSVKDTGLGIPQDKLPRLFDAFTRFHEFEGGKARGGEGLGLYIVKTLVDLMKGKISVTSEVGKGSEFIVTLDFDVA